MNDEQLDFILEQALKDAIRKDLRVASFLAAGTTPVYSPRHLNRMQKMCFNPFEYAKKQQRPAWKKVLRAVACILIIISISFGSIMAVSPDARAWVSTVVTEWFENYIGFRFQSDSDKSSGQWTPGWLPDGFYVSEESYITSGISLIFIESSNGQRIQLEYNQVNEELTLQMDNESSDYYVSYDGENTLYLFYGKTSTDKNTVICVNEEKNMIYKLISTHNINDLILIAERMKEK